MRRRKEIKNCFEPLNGNLLESGFDGQVFQMFIVHPVVQGNLGRSGSYEWFISKNNNNYDNNKEDKISNYLLYSAMGNKGKFPDINSLKLAIKNFIDNGTIIEVKQDNEKCVIG